MDNWKIAGTWAPEQRICYVQIINPPILTGVFPIKGKYLTVYVQKGE